MKSQKMQEILAFLVLILLGTDVHVELEVAIEGRRAVESRAFRHIRQRHSGVLVHQCLRVRDAHAINIFGERHLHLPVDGLVDVVAVGAQTGGEIRYLQIGLQI